VTLATIEQSCSLSLIEKPAKPSKNQQIIAQIRHSFSRGSVSLGEDAIEETVELAARSASRQQPKPVSAISIFGGPRFVVGLIEKNAGTGSRVSKLGSQWRKGIFHVFA